MIEVRRVVAASPERVWSVLADGWLYPVWVVGASRVRAVDTGFPAVGTRVHHSVGAWPVLIDDTTEVLECVPGSRLVLEARGWPLGQARVAVDLSALPGGACRVRMLEDASAGPGRWVPYPFRWLALRPRNSESLHRLALLAEQARPVV